MKSKYIIVIFGVAFVASSILFPMSIYAQELDVRYISFHYRQTGNHDIFIIDTQGERLQRLTHHPAEDFSATWAPDGRSFAYISTRDGNLEIYVMNLNTKVSHRLTNHPARDIDPAWSPDGKWIAFASDRKRNFQGYTDLYKIDANGENLQRLTDEGKHNGAPAWSPDGKKIAFYSVRNQRNDIYIMDANGRNLKRLLANQAHIRLTPSWAPDGKRIVYDSSDFLDAAGSGIYVMDTDGRNNRRLTPPGTWSSSPVWSPDAEWIVYQSELENPWDNPNRDSDIYLIRPDGTDSHQLLTQLIGGEYSPAWVPPSGFFSVSPSVEKQTTLWGRLKQSVRD